MLGEGLVRRPYKVEKGGGRVQGVVCVCGGRGIGRMLYLLEIAHGLEVKSLLVQQMQMRVV